MSLQPGSTLFHLIARRTRQFVGVCVGTLALVATPSPASAASWHVYEHVNAFTGKTSVVAMGVDRGAMLLSCKNNRLGFFVRLPQKEPPFMRLADVTVSSYRFRIDKRPIFDAAQGSFLLGLMGRDYVGAFGNAKIWRMKGRKGNVISTGKLLQRLLHGNKLVYQIDRNSDRIYTVALGGGRADMRKVLQRCSVTVGLVPASTSTVSGNAALAQTGSETSHVVPTAPAPMSPALARYVARIEARVRRHLAFIPLMPSSAKAVLELVRAETGQIVSVKLTKSSGNAAFDDAAERATLDSSPLPVPSDPTLFVRHLKIEVSPLP